MMTIEEMVDAYNTGKSIEKISQESGMSYTGVRYRLTHNGVTLRSRSAHLPKPFSPLDATCKKGHPTKEFGAFKGNGRFYCRECNKNYVSELRKGMN